jgi:D-tyrosyl-tRNA(Tyr) deacylase
VRAVAQRVSRAQVRVEEEVTAAMQAGLLALVGVARADTTEDAAYIAEKLVHLRVFADDEGRMNRSILETGGSLAVISQFTLLGDCRKGRRPAWADAAPPEIAEPLIEEVAARARSLGVSVVTGRFRARMQVELVNEGPVTLLIDSTRVF